MSAKNAQEQSLQQLQIGEHAISCQLVRSRRRTLSIMINEDGILVIKAPLRLSAGYIQDFITSRQDWIVQNIRRQEAQKLARPQYTDTQRRMYMEQAKWQIAKQVAYYGRMMGVTYGRITIRDQKTRWGSCSDRGNLNFNWKLILMPPEVLDYVVVHELAHRRQMNHSPAFWAVVEQYKPDYKACRKWLRDHGGTL